MKAFSVIEKKLHISKLTLAALLSTGSCAYASAANSGSYVGLDAVYSSMKFKKDYGDNIFSKKMIPGINLFAGHMINENFGAEIGYEIDKKMKRNNVRINGGQTVAGGLVATGLGFEDYNTELKQHHTYLGGLGKYNFNNNIFASLMLGVSWSHVNAKFNIFNDGVHGTSQTNVTRIFVKSKLIPMIRATVEYKITDKLGLRALATWRNTSKFKITAEQTGSTSMIKLKDTMGVGAGVSYYII